jgi:hypothetical protein
MVVETHAAAGTQTARYLPPRTTPTITRTPSKTPLPSPTPTATVIFKFSTSTPFGVSTSTNISGSGVKGGGGGSGGGGGGGGGGGDDDGGSGHYYCKVLDVNPPDSTQFSSNETFTTKWKVKNVGLAWDNRSIDYAYLRGEPLYIPQYPNDPGLYDIPNDVEYGEVIELTVRMRAPASRGTYTTVWTMKIGTNIFCPMSLTIIVP